MIRQLAKVTGFGLLAYALWANYHKAERVLRGPSEALLKSESPRLQKKYKQLLLQFGLLPIEVPAAPIESGLWLGSGFDLNGDLRDKMIERVGFEGVDVGPVSAHHRINKQYRAPGAEAEGSTLLFVSRSRSASSKFRAHTAVTVQPSFASLSVSPESVPEDLRDAVREVLPFVSQVNVAFAPFFAENQVALRRYIEQEANLAALAAAVLQERATAVAEHLYFLKQKHLWLRSKEAQPTLSNPELLQEEIPSFPKLVARTSRNMPLHFLKRLQAQGFDGLLLSTDSVSEAESLIATLRAGNDSCLEYQIETRIASFEDFERLRSAGYSRVFVPQEALVQHGPYCFRDFFKTRKPLN